MSKRYKTPLGHKVDRDKERRGARMMRQNSKQLFKELENIDNERSKRK